MFATRIHLHLLLLLFIIFFSCCGNNKKQELVNKIHFKKGNINISESFDFSFVRLETHDECLIGHLSDVEVFENRIFIHDFYKTQSLFVFDTNGQFITKISSSGSNFDEYNELANFALDKENRKIIICDGRKQRLMFFDLDNYQYLYSIDNLLSYTDFFSKNDRFYFFSYYGFSEIRSDNYLMATDTVLNPIFTDWKCQFKTRIITNISRNSIYEQNNQIFTYHHLYPYIYTIKNNNCELHTTLSFEGFEFPLLKKNGESDPGYIKELEVSTKNIRAYAIFDAQNVVLVQLYVGNAPYFALYDKQTEETDLFTLKEYFDSASLDILMLPKNVTNDTIVCSISTDQEFNKAKIKHPALSAIADSIKPDDNPILCFMKWKE